MEMGEKGESKVSARRINESTFSVKEKNYQVGEAGEKTANPQQRAKWLGAVGCRLAFALESKKEQGRTRG